MYIRRNDKKTKWERDLKTGNCMETGKRDGYGERTEYVYMY